MTFLYPSFLYALILPLLLAVAAIWLWRRRSKKWEILIAPAYRKELVHAPATWHRALPVVFAVLAAIFTILAMARPYDGYRQEQQIPESRNILIAIDCSRSMLTRDASPSRLERAKTAAYDLLDSMPGDNFGIIIFSGDALLLVPLTYDHNALKEMIDQLQYGWVDRGGTNLERVMTVALETFKRDKKEDAKNALIILSDGEDTANINSATAEKAKQENLIVVAAGIGTQIGATIPNERDPSGLYKDHRGRHIISKLHEESLKMLASITDGKYVNITDGASLNDFVKDIAQRLEATKGEAQIRHIPNDRYEIFAIPAFICLMLTLIAGTKWRSLRRAFGGHNTATAIMLTLIFCVSTAHGAAPEPSPDTAAEKDPIVEPQDNSNNGTVTDKTTEPSGNLSVFSAIKGMKELIAAGKLKEALKASYEIDRDKLSEINAQELDFLRGWLKNKNGSPQEATNDFSSALLSTDKAMQAESHFNVGNITAYKAKEEMNVKPEETEEKTNNASIDDQIKEIDQRIAKVDKARKHIKNATLHYDDSLNAQQKHDNARHNKEALEKYDRQLKEYKKQLEDLKKKLEEQKQQQQQNKDQQNKDQQNKDQQNKDQQNKDQQNKDQQNKDQQNKDQQNKDQQNKDQQNKDQQDKDQQDKDQQDKDQQDKDQQDKDQQDKDQQDKDQQDKDQQDKDQQDKDQQDKDKNPEHSDDQKDKGDKDKKEDMKNTPTDEGDQEKKDDAKNTPEKDKDDKGDQERQSEQQQRPKKEQDGKPLPVATQKELKEEKERKEARAILQERRDQEPGCPVPQIITPYAPERDY